MLCGLAGPAAVWAAADGIAGAPLPDRAEAGGVERLFEFDIPAQPLADALNRYAFLTQQPAMYASDMSTGRTSSAVQGRYTPEAALQRLLAGTGLTAEKVRTDAGDTFILTEAGAGMAPAAASDADAAHAGMAALLSDRAGYSGLVQNRILQALCSGAGTAPGRYSSLLRFRIDVDGSVRDARLLDSSGNAARDAALLAAVQGVHIDWPPPAGLAQQALTMAILPGAAGASASCSSSTANRGG
jgi:TonB family protein